jgi:hypothetical protein
MSRVRIACSRRDRKVGQVSRHSSEGRNPIAPLNVPQCEARIVFRAGRSGCATEAHLRRVPPRLILTLETYRAQPVGTEGRARSRSRHSGESRESAGGDAAFRFIAPPGISLGVGAGGLKIGLVCALSATHAISPSATMTTTNAPRATPRLRASISNQSKDFSKCRWTAGPSTTGTVQCERQNKAPGYAGASLSRGDTVEPCPRPSVGRTPHSRQSRARARVACGAVRGVLLPH